MKLASLVSGRDGRLVVVDRGLTRAADAGAIAPSLRLPLQVRSNGELFGRARPDIDRVFSFAELLSFATRTRNLGAGTIVGGGTCPTSATGGPGYPWRPAATAFPA